MHKRSVAAGRRAPIRVGAEGDKSARVGIDGTARSAAEMFITLIVRELHEKRWTRGRCQISSLSLQNSANRQTRRQQPWHMTFAAVGFASAHRQRIRGLAAS